MKKTNKTIIAFVAFTLCFLLFNINSNAKTTSFSETESNENYNISSSDGDLNTSKETAYDLKANETVLCSLCQSQYDLFSKGIMRKKYYKIKANKACNVSLTVKGIDGCGSYLSIRTLEGKDLSSIVDNESQTVTFYLNKGTYYFVVEDGFLCDSTYTINYKINKNLKFKRPKIKSVKKASKRDYNQLGWYWIKSINITLNKMNKDYCYQEALYESADYGKTYNKSYCTFKSGVNSYKKQVLKDYDSFFFEGYRIINKYKNKTVIRTECQLASNTTNMRYKIKIRPYVTDVNGKKIYGKWSKIKKLNVGKL